MNISLMYAALFSIGLVSCSKSKPTAPATASTNLELTLKDEAGNTMTDGLGFAQLYSSVDDWSRDRNKIGEPKFADAQGVITFHNLEAKKYYWRVESGCRNNFTTSITTPQPLVANETNRVSVPMTTSFSLLLQKDPAYEYATFHIIVNKDPAIPVPQGMSTINVYNVPAHSSVHVIQITGFTTDPIDTTYTDITADCGQTYVLHYPI